MPRPRTTGLRSPSPLLAKITTLGTRLDQGLGIVIGAFHQLNIWLLLPALALLIITDIALRNLFNAPLSWSHEFLGLLLICLFFLELPYNLRKRDLLQIDLLYLRFNRPTRCILNLLAWLCMLAVALLITWQGYLSALEMYEFEERADTLPIPYWPLATLICVSGGLMSLQATIRLFAAEAKQPTGDPPSA